MDQNNPQNQPPFNPKTPISEVLKQEKEGFTPSANQMPTLGDVVGAINANSANARANNPDKQARIIKTYKSDAEEAIRQQQMASGQKIPMPQIPVAPAPVEPLQPQKVVVPPVFRPSPVEQGPMIKVAAVPEEPEVGRIEPLQKVIQRPVVKEEPVAAPVAPIQPVTRSTNFPRMAQPIEPERQIVYTSEEEVKPKKKILVPVLVVIILLALGGASIPTVQYFLNKKTEPVTVASQRTIIPFDHKDSITLDKATHDNLVSALDKLPANDSNINYIEVSQNILDANRQQITAKMITKNFASILGDNIPSSLVRSFDGDYMFGTANAKKPRSFILFKTTAYDQAFAGMLKWESRMVSDLSPILKINSKATDQNFTDKIITSKDVRAVVSPDGKTYLLYGFIDNQTLLITTDTQAFQDISARYVAARFVQ